MLSSMELTTLAHLIVEEIEQRAKNYNFFTAEQVAQKLNLTVKEVNRKFVSKEIKGAVKKGKTWYISEKDLFSSLFEGACISEKSTAGPL